MTLVADILRHEIMSPIGWNVISAASHMDLEPHQLQALLDGAPVTNDVAQKLETAGFATAKFWMELNDA